MTNQPHRDEDSMNNGGIKRPRADISPLITVLCIYRKGLDSGLIRSSNEESKNEYKRIISDELARLKQELVSYE